MAAPAHHPALALASPTRVAGLRRPGPGVRRARATRYNCHMLTPISAFSGFSVDDLAAARAFYAETLGLEVTPEGIGIGLKLPGGLSVFVYPKGSQHSPATFTVLNF